VLFDPQGTDFSALRTHLLREGRLDKLDAIQLIRTARDVFAKEPNLIKLRDPVSVCGDIHGQFYDLVKLLEVAGDPAKMQYLFLGDYVDRGCFSTEVLFYLFALKVAYPKTLFLLRGNHECRHLTAFFNFKEECVFKYDLEVYEEFMKCFDALPLAATLNDKFLCMHGGLSPDIEKVEEINDINRFLEIPREGAMW
jgi:serine/threonine-protein phosphatase 2B catalytic subunit